jgi:hypothetical protein
MSADELEREVRALAMSLGLHLAEERLPPLMFGLGLMRTSAEAVLRHDYGQTEPASRFRTPPAR